MMVLQRHITGTVRHYPGVAVLGRTDRAPAFSQEAQMIDQLVSEVMSARESSRYLGGISAEARSRLRATYLEALSDNWDGQGANPVDPGAYFMAVQFLESLHPSYRPTDFSVDPDGEVSINWDFGADRTFSVSVGADGRLAYAGRFGPSRTRGVEYFTDTLPSHILTLIQRVQIGLY